MCILCRKKQEVLIKTGSWMQSTGGSASIDYGPGGASGSDPILRKIQDDVNQLGGGTGYAKSGVPSYMTGAGGSSANTPTAAAITSLFSKAISLATPTAASQVPSFLGSVSATASRSTTPTFGQQQASFRRNNEIRRGLYRGSSLDEQPFLSSSSSLSRPLQMTPNPSSYLSPSSHIQHPQHSALSSALPRQRSLESAFSPSGAGSPLKSSLTRRLAATSPSAATPSSRRRNPLLRGQSEGGVTGLSDPYDMHLSATHHRFSSHPLSVTSRLSGRPIHSSPGSMSSLRSLEGRNAYLRKQSSLIIESMSASEDAFDLGSLIGAGAAGGTGSGYSSGADVSFSSYPKVLVSDSEARDLCPPLGGGGQRSSSSAIRRQAYLEPRLGGGSLTSSFDTSEQSAVNPIVGSRRTFTRRKLDAAFRNESLSSDQSECISGAATSAAVRPPPPKPHKRRIDEFSMTSASRAMSPSSRTADLFSGRTGRGRKGLNGSSSEEEIRSTPDYTSCGEEEEEMESESISEKGNLLPMIRLCNTV